MTIADWLVIAAIIIAPIVAVQVQKIIEAKKEGRSRKIQIFKTLMATRATPLSPLHVEALNLIDIEFVENPNVISVWKLLLDNFSSYPQDPKSPDFQARLTTCAEKSSDLLADLLHEMSKTLDYKFDKVLIKRGCYIPKGHGDVELELNFLRRSLVELFLGKKSVPINIVEKKPNQDA